MPPKLYNNTDLHEESHPSINITEQYESSKMLRPAMRSGYIGNSQNSVQIKVENDEEIKTLIKATAKLHESNITPMKLQ